MLRVGITGHRPNRLKVPKERLSERVRWVLRGLIDSSARRGSRKPALEIVSPLAEGTDRIVAREGLALGQRLAAILPFKRKDYETTFTNEAEAIREFRTLWRAAHERSVLKGSLKRPEAAYVAVGMVTLARCDLVIALWDGQAAQGRGGTPEILESALGWGIPIVWIDAAHDRAPRLIDRGAIGKRRGRVGLAAHSREAPRLSARALARLASALQRA